MVPSGLFNIKVTLWERDLDAEPEDALGVPDGWVAVSDHIVAKHQDKGKIKDYNQEYSLRDPFFLIFRGHFEFKQGEDKIQIGSDFYEPIGFSYKPGFYAYQSYTEVLVQKIKTRSSS